MGWFREVGVAGAIERGTGLGTSPKEVSFKRIVNDLSDRLLRARSGAQINEQEFERLTKIVPRLNTSEEVFKAEVRSFIEELDKIVKIKSSLSEQAGKRGLRDPSGKPAPKQPVKQGAFMLGERKTARNGKEYEFIGNGQWQLVK